MKRFIRKEAFWYFTNGKGHGGTEIDDLIQSAFFALLKAVEDYHPGYSFLTFLKYRLKNCFRECSGSSTDPLNNKPRSLSDPLKPEEEATLADVLPDPVDYIEDAEDRIWLEQLRRVMKKAVGDLPEDQREAITGTYYRQRTRRELAEEMGGSPYDVQKRIVRGLDQLRKKNKELEQFVDSKTNFYRPVEETVLFRERLRHRIGRDGYTTER